MSFKTLRTFINRTGVSFDSDKTHVVFAEDMNDIKESLQYLYDNLGSGTPSNSAPTNISLSVNSIAENNNINDIIGAFSTTDPNSGNTFTYTLVSGTGSTDNTSFSITGANLKAGIVFDYETKNSYSIRVRTTDQGGLYFEKEFTINITNVTESAIISLPTQTTITDVSALVGSTLDCKGISTVWSIEYGLTTSYGSTQSGGTTSTNGIKTVSITGLSPETTYHWRFKAVNSDGTVYGVDQSLNTLVTSTNMVQELFKNGSPITNSFGVSALDYSPSPVNASIWQPYLYTATQYQLLLSSNVVIDWTTDGTKLEFIGSIATGQTVSDVVMGATVNHGFRLYTTMFRIYGFQSDGTTVRDIQFTSITTTADDTLWRYRVRKSGVNIIVEKTTVTDTSFASVVLTQTINVSTFSLGNQTFTKLMPRGGLAYMNANGNKFAFCSGGSSNVEYSYNSSLRITLATVASTIMTTLQNVYNHTAMYGYTRAYVEYSTSKEYVNIPYQEDGTPATSFHTAFFTRSAFEEFPASNSFGLGYALKLNASMETYDQGNTFFNSSHVANAVYKNTMPSKLNNRLFFNHTNNNEFLLYSADKTLTRAINTANKKALILGDSMSGDGYYWPVILSQMCGFVRTTKAFSGRTLSTNLTTDLQAQVAITPTLVSDKDFIVLSGGFNDYAQNLSLSTFISGIATLYNYVRAQNPTAPIIICGLYNWGSPIQAGTVANTAGMTRNDIRQAMSDLATNNTNAYYCDWNTGGIVQADISDGLHNSSVIGGYNIAKVVYNRIKTIF
jgi:hypothetical protein